ncbi:MAG: hypothetical protein WC328_11810 [Kiritimatiellia bacterium]|jgi:hypothetical protein|nr:hypothetical protein [Kiritimatiellia bacterium]MDX9793864.1 hypothetical protein [Kiritimatiellia bacterium]
MKTTPPLTQFIVVFAILCGQHCAGQTNVVFYGTNASSIGVSFVDTNLSSSAKTSIVTDLQVCLSEWGKKTYLSLSLGADEPGLVGYLERPSVSPHYPEDIEFPKGVTNTPSGLALQIPKTLSDAYTNAFAFGAANSNIVAAAHEFVAFVSSTNFFNVTSNQISNYFLYNQATPQLYQLAFPGLTNIVRTASYYPPSILGFYYSSEGPAPTNLWLRIPSSAVLHGYVEWDQTTAIWHDGKWKFSIWEKTPHYALPQ